MKEKKKYLGKILAIYIIISLLMPNLMPFEQYFKTLAVDETGDITIMQRITKYIPFANSDEDQGIIMQAKINIVASQLQDSSKLELEIKNPEYSGVKSNEIEIYRDGEKLSQDNQQGEFYSIDSSNTNAKIELKLNGESSLQKEYYVTWKYDKTAYDKYLDSTHVKEYEDGTITRIEKNEETGETWVYIDFAWDSQEPRPSGKVLMDKIPVQIQTKAQITQKDAEISKEDTLDSQMDIAISSFIDTEMKSNIMEVSKGILYAKKEFSYEMTHTMNITRSDILGEVSIDENMQKFINENGESINADALYTKTSIAKKEFLAILGEEGYVSILDENNEEIAKITKDTVEDANGNYEINYENPVSKIKVKTSDLLADGFMSITNTKKLNSETSYAKRDIETFSSYQTIATYNTSDNNVINYEYQKTLDILLKNTNTTASLSFNNNTLSSDEVNSGIEIKLELNNNQENSDLWANPFFIIEMPEEIQDITINDTNILYGNNLQITKTQVMDANGRKLIRVDLLGIQTDYVTDNVVGGTTIIINVDISLKELTATRENNLVKLYYFNESKTNYTNPETIVLEGEYMVGTNSNYINYMTNIEFKTIHRMEGFDEKGTSINSSNGEIAGKIEILSQEKIVNNQIVVMNNTGNENTNIKIMGRLPFVGNKSIDTGEDLGSTFKTDLLSKINMVSETEKTYQVYYTENEQADFDLNKQENGWSTQVNALADVKAYIIVVDKMLQGEKLIFEYKTRIPAMLEHEEYAYSDLITSYENNTPVGNVVDTSKANKIGLTTGAGARMSIQLSGEIKDGEHVTEGQKIKYKIIAQNTGGKIAQNVVVKNVIPKFTSYLEETIIDNDIETYNKYTYYASSNQIEWKLGDIMPGEKRELEYTVAIDNIPSILEYYGGEEGFTEEDGRYYIVVKNEQTGEKQQTEITDLPTIIIKNSASLQADNIDKEIISNETSNEVNKSYFNIIEESSKAKAVYLEEGEIYYYTLIVENKTDLQMKNLIIKKLIPDGLTYQSAEILNGQGNVYYDENTKELKIVSEVFEANGMIDIRIKVKVDKILEDIDTKVVQTNSTIEADGIAENTSNMVTNTIGKPRISASIEADVKQKYVYEGDYIIYTIRVVNENDATISNLVIKNIIPEGTKFISGNYSKKGNDYQILSNGSKELTVETSLGKEEIIIQIKVQVEQVTSDEDEINIEAVSSMSANNVDTMEIGRVKHTIVNNHSNTGGADKGEIGEDGVTRYKLKGLAWEDSNQDGQRQDNETLISGVDVYLLKENGNIAKDYKTGEEKITKTDSNGEYEFRNVEAGNYLIVFMYDNKEYAITDYQKTGVINDRNSDAISKKVIFNSQEVDAGVTDLIQVGNRNLYSIDIGLYKNPKFNLKLEAGITNITVSTKNDSTRQDYNMAQFAKQEIHSKEINGAEVIIEYTLNVINTSDVAGSVTEMMANIPSEITLNSNMNPDWYEGKDKKLYSIALADKILKPGESTQLKMYLSKKMTDRNTGNFDVDFEISETYNQKGIEEENKEDNVQAVKCLITVATGQTPIYIGTALLILVLLAVILYGIKYAKKFKKEKRWK